MEISKSLILDVHLTDFIPLRGSTFFPLPKNIATKKAVINMKNDDNLCFKWSVTRSLNPVDVHPERITKELKDQSERLDWSGLKFPVDLNQIAIFEKNNPQISINVFGFEGGIYPLQISKTKRPRIVDLLLISDGEKQHYCLIKSLSRLLSSQLTKHNGSIVFCLNCLNHFPNEKKIHEEYCLKNEAIKIELAEKGIFISFIHHNRSIKVPFVVYADFEAFTEEISTCEPNQEFSFTKKISKNTDRVDFVSRLSVLIKDSNQNLLFIELRMIMKILAKNSWKCLRRKSRGLKKNLTFQQR